MSDTRYGDAQRRLHAVRSGKLKLSKEEARAVKAARRAGLTWREVGEALGVAHGFVYKKYAAGAPDA